MIAHLSGVVLEKGLSEAIIDVGGVGYRVGFSLLSLARLPDDGQPVRVRVRTVVREDAMDLFGFLSRGEEELFLLLTGVSHVGPKLALSVLSGLEPTELVRALAAGDVPRLTKIRGVGKKTAERLVLELKEKVRTLALADLADATGRLAAPAAAPERDDLVSALLNLGYKPPAAEKAADAALAQTGSAAPFEVLFREAMKALRSS